LPHRMRFMSSLAPRVIRVHALAAAAFRSFLVPLRCEQPRPFIRRRARGFLLLPEIPRPEKVIFAINTSHPLLCAGAVRFGEAEGGGATYPRNLSPPEDHPSSSRDFQQKPLFKGEANQIRPHPSLITLSPPEVHSREPDSRTADLRAFLPP